MSGKRMRVSKGSAGGQHHPNRHPHDYLVVKIRLGNNPANIAIFTFIDCSRQPINCLTISEF